jgi:LDH2 family malate/lactate/ureidoglycolate dehydrogenase
MDNWITRFRAAKTIATEEKLIIPGDPEREFEEERRVNGIPLNDKVVADLQELAKKFAIAF